MVHRLLARRRSRGCQDSRATSQDPLPINRTAVPRVAGNRRFFMSLISWSGPPPVGVGLDLPVTEFAPRWRSACPTIMRVEHRPL